MAKNMLCCTIEHIFNTSEKEEQDFYLNTSILDTFSGPLCDAVTGCCDCGARLEKISSIYCFLIPQDDEHNWYRYHSQVKDFLYTNLTGNESADHISRLHRNAGEWYRVNGFSSQAIEHYLKGFWYEDALKLIESQTNVLAQNCDYSAAVSWIERIPEEYRKNSFEVAYIYAFYYAERNCFHEAQEWIDKMDEIAVHRKSRTNLSELQYVMRLLILTKTNLSIQEGNTDDSIAIMKGSVSNVTQRYQRLDFMDINPYDVYFSRSAGYKMMQFLKMERTDSSALQTMFDEYRALFSKNVGYAPLAEGEFLYESNRLPEALPYLLEAMEASMDVGCPGVLVPAMVTIAKVHKAQGDMRGAFEAIEECEYKLQGCKNPHWSYSLNAFRARMYLDSGDIDAAEKYLKPGSLGVYHEITRAREFRLIVYARLLIAQGLWANADILLKRLLTFCQAFVRRPSTVEILNLLAIISYKNKEVSVSKAYLKRALLIGVKEGYVRSFADEMEVMVEMLSSIKSEKAIIEDNELETYVQELLGSTLEGVKVMDMAKNNTAAGLIEQLTAQEFNILRMLGDAYTNEEIGEKLGITLRTVKAHVSNIYAKMGVKSRTQCIKQAREAGLL